MGSPVKSRNFHLFPDFSGKRHAKTRHVMGSHWISRHSHGKVRTKGGGYIGTNNTVKFEINKLLIANWVFTTDLSLS